MKNRCIWRMRYLRTAHIGDSPRRPLKSCTRFKLHNIGTGLFEGSRDVHHASGTRDLCGKRQNRISKGQLGVLTTTPQGLMVPELTYFSEREEDVAELTATYGVAVRGNAEVKLDHWNDA